MNYIEIKENYPKAFDALAGWLREKQPDRTFVLEETGALKYLWNLNVEYFNIRDLYPDGSNIPEEIAYYEVCINGIPWGHPQPLQFLVRTFYSVAKE